MQGPGETMQAIEEVSVRKISKGRRYIMG